MSEHDGRPETADPVAELIRAAGPRAVPSRETYDQVFAATHRAWKNKVGRRRARRWVALAASVTVAVVAGGLYQLSDTADSLPAARIAISQGEIEMLIDNAENWQPIAGTQNLAPGAHLRTGTGAASLLLASGGTLRLDQATEIVVGASTFELIAGKLYFDSFGRTPATPISIETTLGTVQDIGTQFEVLAADERLRVRVRSGQVSVTGSRSDVEVVGDTGTEIEVTPDGTGPPQAFAPDDPDWSWVEALAIAPASQSILSYLEWIARETGKGLEFQPRYLEQSASTTDFVGSPEGMTPMEILEYIELTSQTFHFEMTNGGTILVQRNEP